MAKFTTKLVATLTKPEGAYRVDVDPSVFDRIAELNRQYPNGDWEGDVHSELRLYAIVRV